MLMLFHDYTSPASAVAVLRAQKLADEGLPVAFEGFEAIGVDATLPVTLDALAEIDQLTEQAAALGLLLARPPAQPPTAAAHVVGALAEELGLGASWREACYRAFWERGADIGAHEVLRQLAERAGLPSGPVTAALTDHDRFRRHRLGLAARRSEGIGGVPTILTHRTLVPGLVAEADLRALAAL